MTIAFVLGALPNGTVPIDSGPALRPAPSVAIAVKMSPELDVTVAVKLPSLLIETDMDADVVALRTCSVSGDIPVTAPAVPVTVAMATPSNAMLIRELSMRGRAATFSTI